MLQAMPAQDTTAKLPLVPEQLELQGGFAPWGRMAGSPDQRENKELA